MLVQDPARLTPPHHQRQLDEHQPVLIHRVATGPPRPHPAWRSTPCGLRTRGEPTSASADRQPSLKCGSTRRRPVVLRLGRARFGRGLRGCRCRVRWRGRVRWIELGRGSGSGDGGGYDPPDGLQLTATERRLSGALRQLPLHRCCLPRARQIDGSVRRSGATYCSAEILTADRLTSSLAPLLDERGWTRCWCG